MHEADTLENEIVEILERNGIQRLRIAGSVEDLLEIVERRLRLPVHADDVAQLLHRPEDEERIEERREELADRDLSRKDEIEHQEKNARAHQVDEGALHEAKAAEVSDLLQLELQNLVRRRVQP